MKDDSSAGAASSDRFRSRPVRVLVLGAAVAAPLLIVFLALEWWLRTYHPEYARDTFSESVFDRNYNHTLRPNHEEVFGFENTVIERHFNSWGMAERREPEVPKPPDVWRVLVMGDSFMQAPSEAVSISGVLERALEGRRTADGKRIEVLNGGQSSYSPLLYLTRLRHQFNRLDADAIILAPDVSDVYDDYCRYRHHVVLGADGAVDRVLPSTYGVFYLRALDRLGYYGSRSYAYRWMLLGTVKSLGLLRLEDVPVPPEMCTDIFEHASLPENAWSPHTRQAFNFTLDNLGLFIEEADRLGAHLFIFTYPYREELIGEWNRAFERGVEDLCRRRGIPFRSFFNEMGAPFSEGVELFLKKDMHYSADGYLILSQILSRFVLENPREGIGADLKPPGNSGAKGG